MGIIFQAILCFTVLNLVTISAQAKPNIVFIFVDDLGWNDAGFTGRSDLQTPNIDALAYNGRILTQHYASPSCSPSRSALLTGKYAIRTGMQGFPILPGVPSALSLEHVLLPQHLKNLGYQTHLVGKWHLGYHKWQYTPTNRGFDTHFGYFNGFIGYFDHQIIDFKLNNRGHDFWRNKEPVYNLKGRYVTNLLTEESIRLIQEKRDDQPLFLLLSHLAPHAGNLDNKFEYLPQDIERFDYIRDLDRRKYAAMVWRLDWSVGQVVQALAKKEILNNTIIVFASDNGAQTVSRFSNRGSNFPLRGTKLTVFEAGIRTVAAIWSPILLDSHNRGVYQNIFHITDWLPTLYEAAGGDLRELSGLDGRSQWSSLQGEDKAVRTEMLLNIDEKTGQRAVRHHNWKLLSDNGFYFEGNSIDGYYGNFTNVNYTYDMNAVLTSQVNKAMISQDFYTTSEYEALILRDTITVNCQLESQEIKCLPDKNPCLFNILTDPCERVNMASVKPEMVELLQAKLQTYESMLTPQLSSAVADPLSFPSLHNNTWKPWIDDDDDEIRACLSNLY